MCQNKKTLVGKIFTEEMTSSEARLSFFKAVDGKTKEEIEQLLADYFKVLPTITKRELEMAQNGWFID